MEPRSLPGRLMHRTVIVQREWYCLECGEGRTSESDVRTHLRASCMEWEEGKQPTPEKGVDYAQGSQVILMQLRREQWIGEAVEAFHRDMHPGFTPDDFVAEAEIRG